MSAEVVRIARRSPLRPQPRGEQRRAALLAALEQELQHRELAAIVVGDVASAAGLTRSAFYFYFPTKQAAVVELLGDMFADQRAEVEFLLGEAEDPREGFAAALAMVFREWRAHRALLLALLDARDSDPDTRATWRAWLGLYEEFFARHLREQRADGYDIVALDETLLARNLIAMNERVLERHLRDAEGEDAALELHAVVTHIWVASCFGPGGAS